MPFKSLKKSLQIQIRQKKVKLNDNKEIKHSSCAHYRAPGSFQPASFQVRLKEGNTCAPAQTMRENIPDVRSSHTEAPLTHGVEPGEEMDITPSKDL